MSSEVPFPQARPEWEVTTLGELCRRGGGEIQTGPFGSQLHADAYVVDGIPVIMPQDLVDGRIDTASIAQVGEEDAARLSRHRVREGDIVYSRRGDIRRRALIGAGQAGWLCGTGCLRVRVGMAARPEYLAAYLGHPAVQGWIERHAVGATMLNLNTKILSAVPVLVPDRDEQRRVAEVLSALDEKIDSNRRLAALLEETAATLFRARFVDFVGVDEFEDSELGPVPRGWRVGALADLVDVTMGQSPPGTSYSTDTEGGLPLVQGMGGFGERYPKVQIYTSAPTKRARAGATLMTVRAPVGAVNVARTELCLGRGVAGIASEYRAFTECLVRSLRGRWASEESGTIFPAVNRKQIVGLRLVVPPREAVVAFEQVAAPIVEYLLALHDETELLTAARDGLLPKLISGEIRVPDNKGPVEMIETTAEAVSAVTP